MKYMVTNVNSPVILDSRKITDVRFLGHSGNVLLKLSKHNPAEVTTFHHWSRRPCPQSGGNPPSSVDFVRQWRHLDPLNFLFVIQ